MAPWLRALRLRLCSHTTSSRGHSHAYSTWPMRRGGPLLLAFAQMAAAAAEPAAEPYVVQVHIDQADRPSHEWNTEGVAAFEGGELRAAVQKFTVATQQHTANGALWANLGLALGTLSGENPVPLASLAELCEAKAAAQLGHHLGHHVEGLLDGLQGMEDDLASATAGATCANGAAGSRQAALDAALMERDAAHAARRFCTAPNLVLKVGDAERARGILSARTLRLAWGLMHVCGLVYVEDLLASELVDDVAVAQKAHFANVSTRVAEMRARGAESDAELAIRGSVGRLEVKLPLRPPFSKEDLLAGPLGARQREGGKSPE